MPKLAKTTCYVRYAHELAFSIYFPLLLIWVNDASSGWANARSDKVPWVLKLELLITGGYRHHSPFDDPALRFAFVFLWVVSATVVFLCIRTVARFPFTAVFLRTFAGIVAVAGFPLTCVYAFRAVSWTLVEIGAALICVYLYVSRNWPSRTLWGVMLLVLHFTFWSLYAWSLHNFPPPGGVPLLWPGYGLTSLTHKDPLLIYPLAGFGASLAWGLYVRQSKEERFSVSSGDGNS